MFEQLAAQMFHGQVCVTSKDREQATIRLKNQNKSSREMEKTSGEAGANQLFGTFLKSENTLVSSGKLKGWTMENNCDEWQKTFFLWWRKTPFQQLSRSRTPSRTSVSVSTINI